MSVKVKGRKIHVWTHVPRDVWKYGDPMTSFCICVIKYTIKIKLRSGQMDVFSFSRKKGDLGRTAVFKMKSKTVLRKIQNGFQKMDPEHGTF